MEKLSLEVPFEISQKLIPYQDKLSELVMLGLQQFRIQIVNLPENSLSPQITSLPLDREKFNSPCLE